MWWALSPCGTLSTDIVDTNMITDIQTEANWTDGLLVTTLSEMLNCLA